MLGRALTYILAAGVLRRHSRGRTRRRMLGLRLGAAVPRRAPCGTSSCRHEHSCSTRRVNDAGRHRRLRTWHGRPAEGRACEETAGRRQRHWR